MKMVSSNLQVHDMSGYLLVIHVMEVVGMCCSKSVAARGLICGSKRLCMWQQEALYVAARGFVCGSGVAARGCICGSNKVCMWQQVWQWCGSNTGFWTCFSTETSPKSWQGPSLTLVALSLCFRVPPFWSRAVVAIMVAMRASHQKSGENEGKSLSFSYGRIRNISTGKHVIHKAHLVSHTIAMATEYAMGNRNRFCF